MAAVFLEFHKYIGTCGEKGEKWKATETTKKLRADGIQRHRKERQSGQPDDYLNFRCTKLQVNRHLPILTFTNVHINYYDCGQNFP